jgi:hypothetical protein
VNAISQSAATGTATTPPPAPGGTTDNNGGAGAGSYGLLIILGLIVVSIGLFVAMNRSLRRARRNLGGDLLPRRRGSRPRHVIPLRDDESPDEP